MCENALCPNGSPEPTAQWSRRALKPWQIHGFWRLTRVTGLKQTEPLRKSAGNGALLNRRTTNRMFGKAPVQTLIKILALNAVLTAALVAAPEPGTRATSGKPYQERLGEPLDEAAQGARIVVATSAPKGDRLPSKKVCDGQSDTAGCGAPDTGSVRWITVAEPANGHVSVLRRVPGRQGDRVAQIRACSSNQG